MMAPTAMNVLPTMICRGRPKISPVQIVDRAPTKQPRLYTEVMVLCILVDGLPIVCKKFSPMRTLPKTPCDQVRIELGLSDGRQYLIIAVEDKNSRGSNGYPNGQALAGAAEIFPCHLLER